MVAEITARRIVIELAVVAVWIGGGIAIAYRFGPSAGLWWFILGSGPVVSMFY
jgi:hypothetical protein